MPCGTGAGVLESSRAWEKVVKAAAGLAINPAAGRDCSYSKMFHHTGPVRIEGRR